MRVTWRRCLAVLLLGLTVAVGACGSDGSSADAGEAGADGEKEEISRAEPGRLRVAASGDVSIDFDEQVDLRIVVIRNEEVTAVRFLSVGIERMQDIPEGGSFRIAFDLAGQFDGEGSYELPAAGSSSGPPISVDPENPQNAAVQGLSKPFLIYAPGGNPDEDQAAFEGIRSFENVLEACELEIEADDGGAGRLDCPAVTDAEGEGRVAFTMEWDTDE